MSAPPKKSASPAVFMHLTESAISIMLKLERQQTKDSDFKPVLQVTDIQLLSNSSNSSERYLVTLSDGTHTHNGMLATGRNDLVRSQLLRKGSVVQVSLFFSTVIQNRRLLIIIDLDLLLEKCVLIGDPKPLVLKVNKGNASSSVKAKESNLPLPNSVFSEITETMTDVFKEKLAKKEASFRRAYEIEKKAREAAEKKLIEEQKANRQLRKELESIKTHSPAQSKYRNVENIMDVTSPATFIETSRPGIFKESENFAESEVVNRLPTPPPPIAEEPPEKIERVKLVVRRKKTAPLRKCLHCEVTETAQWRAGPLGPGTLCNACGVCFKRGRLYPEYRPAASPTFVPEVHSNSHKEVLQMRGTTPKKQKTV